MMVLFRKRPSPAKKMLDRATTLLEYIEDRRDRVEAAVARYSATSTGVQQAAEVRSTKRDGEDA